MADTHAGARHEDLRRDQREPYVATDRKTGDHGEVEHERVLQRAQRMRLFPGSKPQILGRKLADNPGPLILSQPGRRFWPVGQ